MTNYAPVAQLDRVLGYEPSGRRFESFQARHINKKAPPIFYGGAFLFIMPVGLVLRSVRKNRQERFLTSAPFADGPKGEGRTARVILPGAPYNQALATFSFSPESECVAGVFFITYKDGLFEPTMRSARSTRSVVSTVE